MRRIAISFVLALPVAACAESAEQPLLEPTVLESLHVAQAGPERVTGHWEITFFGGYVGKYSSNAVRQPDESVTGEFELHEIDPTGARSRVHGSVTCMSALPDGTVLLGGVVEQWTYDVPIDGKTAIWIVQDNGEGRNAVDMASDIRYGYWPGANDEFCNGVLGLNPFVFEPVERGNIQVRP